MIQEYDLIIIGGGPGGYVAAISAARHGLRVMLAEEREAGGTCLNRGCIPTKALLHCSGLYRETREGARFGVTATDVRFDYSAASAHKEQTVKTLRRGVETLLKKNGCDVRYGHAAIRDGGTVDVGGEVFGYRDLILATGSKPARPPFPIEEGSAVVDSDGFLAMTSLPERAVIVGGGVIGLEFATVLSDAGCAVTVIEATPRVLPPLSPDLASCGRDVLEKRGVAFLTSAFVRKIRPCEGQTVCDVEQNGTMSEIGADLVICATGRTANTAGLGLDRIGVRTVRSFISTDDRYCCAPHVYAIGDCNGRCMLAHAASAQGKQVVENLAAGKDTACPDLPIPSCVYTSPELAQVGLTPDKAAEAGLQTKTGFFYTQANGKAIAMGETAGFVRLTADASTNVLLGAEIAAPHASDMIGVLTAWIGEKRTVEELASAVFPHPSVSEMVLEAAENCLGRSIHKL